MKSYRLLPRLKSIYTKQNNLYLLSHRNILSYSNPIDIQSNNTNEPQIHVSTQYPPLPLEQRVKQKPSGSKIEPYKDVQFKSKKAESKSTSILNDNGIPIDLDLDNDDTDPSSPPTTPEEELSLGEYEIDPLELKKMIPHGTASKEEIQEAMAAEDAEWKGVHWSERQYTAKLGDIVNRQRPKEVTRLMESSKPDIHKDGLRSIKPVEAGGPAYPIFYDPSSGQGLNRPQAAIPKDRDGRKSRVMHISSLKKITGMDYSECAMEYDQSAGQYSIALEKLRNKQINKLNELTGKPKDQCKKFFDQCLGNFDKALRKLQR